MATWTLLTCVPVSASAVSASCSLGRQGGLDRPIPSSQSDAALSHTRCACEWSAAESVSVPLVTPPLRRKFQHRVVAFLLVSMMWEEFGHLRLPESMIDMMLAAQVISAFVDERCD